MMGRERHRPVPASSPNQTSTAHRIETAGAIMPSPKNGAAPDRAGAQQQRRQPRPELSRAGASLAFGPGRGTGDAPGRDGTV